MPNYNYRVTITNLETNEQQVRQLKVMAPTREQAEQNVYLALEYLKQNHTLELEQL